jgi:hypothetical protein
MYIFVSHSSKDKAFARRLVNSVEFYGIPYFLDEREIKVGENIPETIYNALGRATHVIYVISKNSINSKWVAEELSVAKTRQLSNQGCTILPALIDDVTPPASISHIKYADFRKWEVKESYFESLREMLVALGVHSQYATSGQLRFYLQHLPELVKVKETADRALQLYFQLERLWFSLFEIHSDTQFKISRLNNFAYWFYESVNKTVKIADFLDSVEKLTSDEKNISSSNKVLVLSQKVKDDLLYFSKLPTYDTHEVYQRVWKAEESARELSALITSIFLELNSVVIP